ncbi:UNKNOWN [Stylonychia lemnae]|uniref:GT44 domain-containing protein n=1 Tax=Stylonychia lemnae TaxID=5949 RepID=A0A077ZYV4_STYLE|nr:UNKNOWN [Stylonychia lemnae]|eukprot:CDW73718.1 UNKNOWN [Stylonychia lemnae]
MEDVIDMPMIKPIYKILSKIHLTSNLLLDFCWLGKQITLQDEFIAMYMRQYNVAIDDLKVALDTEAHLKKVYTKSDKPKIPLQTHRTWLTSPNNPIEIFDYLKDPIFFDRMIQTNKLLDSNGEKWNHFIWTNDRSLSKKTFQWFEENGFIIREFKEIPYDEVLMKMFDKYMEKRELGKAADILKLCVLYHYGGMALDLDVFLPAFSNEWNYIFDSIWVREIDYKFGVAILNNDLMLAKPHHPILQKYYDLFKQQYIPQEKHYLPIQSARCLSQTDAKTPFEGGIFLGLVALAKEFGKDGHQDISLYPKNKEKIQNYKIKVQNNEVVTIPFSGKSVYICSWMNNYSDALGFGFY